MEKVFPLKDVFTNKLISQAKRFKYHFFFKSPSVEGSEQAHTVRLPGIFSFLWGHPIFGLGDSREEARPQTRAQGRQISGAPALSNGGSS